jgi:hypothetical protein
MVNLQKLILGEDFSDDSDETSAQISNIVVSIEEDKRYSPEKYH